MEFPFVWRKLMVLVPKVLVYFLTTIPAASRKLALALMERNRCVPLLPTYPRLRIVPEPRSRSTVRFHCWLSGRLKSFCRPAGDTLALPAASANGAFRVNAGTPLVTRWLCVKRPANGGFTATVCSRYWIG